MSSHAFKFAVHRQRRGGFTLLELVLVMLVLSMVAAMVVPALRNFARGRRLSDAAAQVVAYTNYARTQAIAQGKVYRLNLDLGSGTYWLTARTYDVFDKVGDEFGHVATMPENVLLDSDLAPQQDGLYIEFRPTGRIDAGVIWLKDEDGTTKEIVCDSPTELYHIVD